MALVDLLEELRELGLVHRIFYRRESPELCEGLHIPVAHLERMQPLKNVDRINSATKSHSDHRGGAARLIDATCQSQW